MEMTLRWYGTGFDTVTLKEIRQIPGVTGVITTLYDTKPGEVWSRERIRALKQEVEAAGLHISGIESVNVHDAIKTGAADRDVYIGRYIETLENLGQEDIHLVCYNFMPVFDWTRTELARLRPDGSTVLAYTQEAVDRLDPETMFSSIAGDMNGTVLPGWEPERMARLRPDGSTVLAYTQEAVDRLDPETMFSSIAGDMNGTVLPGWEPERMARVKELFAMYRDMDEERLFENLRYFLEQIMPVCRKYDIRMAIHPDDPAWSVFGLPRIMTNKENVLRIMDMVDDPHNGVAFCTGSFGTSRVNDLPDMIRALKGRIHFAHVRNLKFNSPTDFEEAAHLSSDGGAGLHPGGGGPAGPGDHVFLHCRGYERHGPAGLGAGAHGSGKGAVCHVPGHG